MLDQEWKMRGTVVLVHPELTNDPLDKQNQVGVICEANLEHDDIYVDFVDKTGLYTSDSLFTFLPLDDMLPDKAQLSTENQKALYKIRAFLSYNEVNWNIKAMQIARDHPQIQPQCIETLKNQITRHDAQDYGL